MRIAVYDNLPEGGAKRVVFEQVRLLSTNHQVFYFTNTHDSIFPFEQYTTSITRYKLDLPHYHGWQRPRQEFSLLEFSKLNQGIAKAIDGIQPDVVLCHHCQITQTPLILLFLQTPSVLYIEEPLRVAFEPSLFPIVTKNPGKYVYEYLRRKLLAQLDKLAVLRASYLITNSNYTQRNVLKYYHRTSQTVHPGVDLKTFYPAAQPVPRHFLFIGEKENINGYDLLQSAIHNTQQNILVKYVSFKNKKFALSDMALRKLYQDSYATLCLAHHEPFGLTAIESMACGTPVIARDEGGYQETVDRKVGVLIPGNPESLAAALLEYSTKKKLAERSKLCRQHVADNFSWESHCKKLTKYLEKAAKL